MFGTNPVRKQDLRLDQPDVGTLDVHEIFPTIQGEGPFSGQPCIFLRLWGCNLRCYFCDTDFETRRLKMDPHRIMESIERTAMIKVNTKLIVITGGEPLRQNILPLCVLAATMGWDIQIETAGTLWVPGLEELIHQGRLTLVCSPKTGKVDDNVARWCTDWKYLVRKGQNNEIDGLPDYSTQEEGKKLSLYRPTKDSDTIWLQPCEEYAVAKIPVATIGVSGTDQMVTSKARNEGRSEENIIACGAIAMAHGYRVSLQMHKYLKLP